MASEQSGHILVVDDNRVNRLTLARSLEQQGHTVSLAENGKQALDMVRAESFDVALLDILMPEMDGFQVLERIKADQELRDIPVIVISALDDIESAVRCIEMGAEDYLPKPFDPVLLRARLRASLQKKRLRDLEVAYLRQEVMLRQNEKLATLGKLSAGLAHELNNPAAAAARSAGQLRSTVAQLQDTQLRLGALGLSSEQHDTLLQLDRAAQQQVAHLTDMSAIAQSDRASEVESWLGKQGVVEAWEHAPTLASMAYEISDLAALQQTFSAQRFPIVVVWLSQTYTVYSLLEEIAQGTGRMTELVRALKTYTYLDRAPVQAVDVHEGLDSTLVMLRSKLKDGITVRREYAANLPRIQAYASELNQVWTNLIDNAADAMDGKGEIVVRTRQEGAWVVVAVEDNGPGIPEALQPNVFDPFFTTKPPGEGTGLGLNISHNIIVQKHGGTIALTSQPGKTQFEVRLPLKLPTEERAAG
ncbi:MAG TPA: response regulator [Ktedonobacterales bacterium]|nr:response regulator [Ktedonobacterales bacterium]